MLDEEFPGDRGRASQRLHPGRASADRAAEDVPSSRRYGRGTRTSRVQRRRLLATAGAVTITAFATTVGPGRQLRPVRRDRARLPRRAARHATGDGPGARHPRRDAGHHDPAGRRRRRLIPQRTDEPAQDVDAGRQPSSSSTRTGSPVDRVRERQSPGVEERAVEHQHRAAARRRRRPPRRGARSPAGARGSGGSGRSPAGTRAVTPPARGTRRRPRRWCGRSDHPPAPPCASGGAPSGRWARRSHRAPTSGVPHTSAS